MDWNMMDPIGASFSVGDVIDGTYIPADDCLEILEEMLEKLTTENKKDLNVRRRMALEKVLEKELLPLLKANDDQEIFLVLIRLLANLTQPFDMCICPKLCGGQALDELRNEITNFVTATKKLCTDMDVLKSLNYNIKDIVKKTELESSDSEALGHTVLFLRNLLHIRPGTSPTDPAAITHQCLLSSFFMNEIDKCVLQMLSHKHKEQWTIGLAQLISFVFKDYSASLLEPDIDDSTSTSSSHSEDRPDVVEVVGAATGATQGKSPSDPNLSSNFKDKLQICADDTNIPGGSDDDFMLEFKSTADGCLEIKLTPQARDEVMEEGSTSNGSCCVNKQLKSRKGSISSLDSEGSQKEADTSKEDSMDEKEVLSGLSSCSCLMDLDIIVSYLKQFATSIMYSGFVELVEIIMRALLTKYDGVLDHSFLMWTVGFFLSFAHQQDLDISGFKEILNLDLFGFLVYEAVKSCELLEVKSQKQDDCSAEKHRLHLVVCTLNQMFRTLMANTKRELVSDYLQNVQKCMSHMSDLRNLFALLIRLHKSNSQSSVYLRDLIQTNHVLMLMLEDWLSNRYITEQSGFSMLDHVQQFATRQTMAKYGSMLEHHELSKDSMNIAILTMMYHVAGDCQKQDTLIQLPILKSFSEIWVNNAVTEHDEFKDLIEYILEIFMSDAEKDPNKCAQDLFDSTDSQNSNSGDEESPMNTDSNGSYNRDPAAELSEEEQNLIFSWMSELDTRSSELVDTVVRQLTSHGFTRSHQQVRSYMAANGFIEDPSPSSSSQFGPNSESKTHSLNFHENSEILRELSSLSEDHLIPFLLDKLRDQGFESYLIWLQKQLLEAAYVKLGIKAPAYRIHVEEPVCRFYALQNKSIPIIPWNANQQRALSNPYFHLLQQSLGLYTIDDPNIIYPRIPEYLTPTLLVNKARQIGPIESLFLKFDVDTLKECTGIDISQGDPPSSTLKHSMDIFRPVKNVNYNWLSVINKVNTGVDVANE